MASIAVPAIISGVSALAGLLGNRPKTTTSTKNETVNSSQEGTQNFWRDTSGTSMPNYSPEMLSYRDQILKMLRDRALQSADMSGYTAYGLRNINAGYRSQQSALDNILAARGLSYSPAAATALSSLNTRRVGEQLNFQNQIPLLQRQLQGEDLNSLASFFKSLPVGTTTHSYDTGDAYTTSKGSQHTEGSYTGTDPGNMAGGAVAGLGAGLAATLPKYFPAKP